VNQRQRIILWITAGIAVLMLLYAPLRSSNRTRGYGWTVVDQPHSVDYARLLIQYVILGGIAWMLYSKE
jgi:hypothetical protein